MIDMGKLLGPDRGTKQRADRARAAKIANRANYRYGSTGVRMLTDRELVRWYDRLDQCLGRKVRVPDEADFEDGLPYFK